MTFTIGDLLVVLDKTILNPFVAVLLPAYLQFCTDSKVTFVPHQNGLLYSIQGSIPRPLLGSLLLLVAGTTLRVNRFLSSRALNNGVSAKFDWPKEVIVVTGGSGGIGGEAVKTLASRGSTIVVLDVIPLTFSKPDNVHYYKCDLTNFEAVQAAAVKIAKEVGTPTCVVANAGICRGNAILNASKRDIELTFAVNNLGLLWTAKAFLPSMVEKNHGHFLIISSQTGYLATAGVVDYAASKAATLNIFEGLQTELKHVYKAPAIRVSCIAPSAVSTKMFAGIKAGSNFFMPRLTPESVGSLIAEVLWSGKSQNLMTPAFAYISVPTKVLPDWMRIGMQDGGADVMSELKPHKPEGLD
ncbi:MAG: hypothetical protein M1819_003341 [Sarea resinae]|nr:MAG: hypothetical protein M1819_003341 [Sarea resinae]